MPLEALALPLEMESVEPTPSLPAVSSPPQRPSRSFALPTVRPLGSTEPRLWTKPLRELTPETSYGYAVIAFARDVLGEPLDPWQEWLVIHAGELLPDGRPRFRRVLVLVSRQNGKTHVLRCLMLYWLFVECWPLILGLSTDRSYAKRTLHMVAQAAQNNEILSPLLPNKKNRGLSNETGSESLTTADGCEYLIAANNDSAGRSLSIDRLFIDEIRHHTSFGAWDACINAMNARPFGQAFIVSNQGDDKGVVLDDIHKNALEALKAGSTKYRTGLFEWSAPEGADLLDVEALAQANPNLGRRVLLEDLWDKLVDAVQTGGKLEASERTSVLCQRVRTMDGAVNAARWAEGYVRGNLANLRSRIAMFVDISPDRTHASLAGAAVMPDGRVRVELLTAWETQGRDTAATQLARELPGLIDRNNPQRLGYMPGGPAAVLMANLADRRKAGRFHWPPPGVEVVEIRDEVSAVCMGFADQVDAGQVVHDGDDQSLLTKHVTGAGKLWYANGERWRFQRKGEGHCDAAYAAAGAVHLARTLPTLLGPPRILGLVGNPETVAT